MGETKQIFSANDNTATSRGRIYSMPEPAVPIRPASLPEAGKAAGKNTPIWAWAVPILAVFAGVFSLLSGPSADSLIWPAVLIAGLLSWTAARAGPKSRLRNISTLLLVGAITTGLSAFLAMNGLPLMAAEVLVVISAIGLAVGWSFKSRPAGAFSALAALTYLATLFPQLGLFEGLIDGQSFIGLAVIPVVLLGLAALANRIQTRAILLIVLTAGYIWIIASATEMPLSALTGLGFALAAAHYSLGRAWADQKVFGAGLHILFGALLALLTAFYAQSLWMAADTTDGGAFWPPDMFWWSVFGSAIFIVFITCLMRYKSSRISMIGIFIISAAAVILPMITANPDFAEAAFASIPVLDANPGVGLLIGAAIIAFGLSMVVEGLRTSQLRHVLIGASAIGIEGLMLIRPDRMTFELVLIFVISLICALGFGGLIAGSTSEKSKRGRHYA